MDRLSEAIGLRSGGGSGGMDRGLVDYGGGITFDFPKRDASNFFKSMERGRVELGWSLGNSLRRGSWALINSIGTSTKVAPAKRKFHKDLDDSRRIEKQKKTDCETKRLGYNPVKQKEQLWVVKTKLGNKRYFRAKGKREANKHPFVRIANRGLAKYSWAWGMGSLGGRGSSTDVTQSAKQKAPRRVQVTSNLRGDDPWVKVTNKLDYITSALRGGLHSVDTAMERAARGLQHEIDKTLAKKFGAH